MFLKLTCGDTVRFVQNIVLTQDHHLGCSIVNNHDDLFDLGFRPDELEKHGLKIEPVANVPPAPA